MRSEPMTNFEQLVRSMREAQRRYFRERTPEALELSKQMEREVDKALKERSEAGQGKLFKGEI